MAHPVLAKHPTTSTLVRTPDEINIVSRKPWNLETNAASRSRRTKNNWFSSRWLERASRDRYRIDFVFVFVSCWCTGSFILGWERLSGQRPRVSHEVQSSKPRPRKPVRRDPKLSVLGRSERKIVRSPFCFPKWSSNCFPILFWM